MEKQRAKTANGPPVAGYRIGGVVVDASTGSPVAGAELSIAEAAAELNVKADGEGKFVFEGLEPGKYIVQAEAPGYVRTAYNEHRGFSTAMVVGNGLDSEHMVFKLHRQAVIAGTVTDERGEVVRRAQVMLFVEDGSGGFISPMQRRRAAATAQDRSARMVAQKETDDLGAYRFAHLRAGKYFVVVNTRPWYAQANLENQACQFVRQQQETGEAGSTGFEAFSTSDCSVSERRAGPKLDPALDVVYPTTFYPGVSDEHSAGEVVVGEGETQEADVHLQAVPALHVMVTGLPENPPNASGIGIGATQKIFDLAGIGLPVAVGPVGTGAWEVAGLPPGDVALIVNENRNGEWENRTIHLDARNGDRVDANGSGAAANVSGRVIFAEGGVAAQGDVALSGKGGQASARLQKDGTFSIPRVETGTYEVQVNLNGSDDYVKGVTAAGTKVFGQEVRIEEPGEVQLTIQMGKGLGEVKGLVTAEGKPKAGSMVLLIPASGENVERDSRMDQSDSDGTFTLAGIVPGKYVLVAIEDGWDLDWRDPEVLRPYLEKGKAMELGPYAAEKVEIEEEKKLGSKEVMK